MADADFRHTGGEGNGSLMRTGVVALAHPDDPAALAAAARAVSALTHAGPLSQEACVLWSAAVAHALTHDAFNVRDGLALLPEDRRDYWRERIDEAETRAPATFAPNGFVVTALQAAWSAIVHTPAGEPGHLAAALGTVIAIGDDTDTTAAIAGALLGARWGADAIPEQWREALHGYPGITGEDLAALASRCGDR